MTGADWCATGAHRRASGAVGLAHVGWRSSRLVRSCCDRDGCLMSIETGGSAVKKVHLVEVGSVEAESQRLALPEQVQLAMFEIAESAKEGLLALAVGAGLAVLHECMEYGVDRVVGPKGRHDRVRTAKRHGRVGGEVTLGGRRVPSSRPRVRSADDSAEVALASYAEFASRDLLERVALERMLARDLSGLELAIVMI